LREPRGSDGWEHKNSQYKQTEGESKPTIERKRTLTLCG